MSESIFGAQRVVFVAQFLSPTALTVFHEQVAVLFWKLFDSNFERFRKYVSAHVIDFAGDLIAVNFTVASKAFQVVRAAEL